MDTAAGTGTDVLAATVVAAMVAGSADTARARGSTVEVGMEAGTSAAPAAAMVVTFVEVAADGSSMATL
jgi:hypothetical protein